MSIVRNTPLQSRKARKGYTPLPGKSTILHPALHVAPLRTHVKMISKDTR